MFEVFPSGGSWRMLIGKPLLEQLKASHNYDTDLIFFPFNDIIYCVSNFAPRYFLPQPFLPTAISFPKASSFPHPPTHKIVPTNIQGVQMVPFPDSKSPPVKSLGAPSSLPAIPHNDTFTRHTEKGPLHPPRVRAILDAVQLGDISPNQRYVFTLSVKEVTPLPSTQYHLNIPVDTSFSVKVHQCPLTQAQKEFYFPRLVEFVNAGILRPIHISEVKVVHPTVLAHRAYENLGLTMDEIRQEVNEQCILLGEPPDPSIPRCIAGTSPQPVPSLLGKIKWRITQNFNQLSQICKVAPLPQGDLHAKQQCLAGHHFICIIDFASGYYALQVAEESQPYLCIYMEGVRYHAYVLMPMGIHDAPSWFCDMTGRALWDLTTQIQLKTFVNNNAIAGDEFTDVLSRLRVFFQRCHDQNLSILPQKTRLFMAETTFGGSRIGGDGIKADVAKLEAVAKWPIPNNLLDLMWFLGLTGYFCSLIKDYACVASPLTDLQRNLDLPQPDQWKGCRKYRQFLRDRNLAPYWTPCHNQAFTHLKQLLLDEPVLRTPRFDGTPFILVTDASKDGFGTILLQQSASTLLDDSDKPTLYPIGFASKRTALAEGGHLGVEFSTLLRIRDRETQPHIEAEIESC